MENEINTKRGLIIILVVATVVIFVAVVWVIATSLPWGKRGAQQSTATLGVLVASDCTRPVAYWKDHPELFPTQLIIGGVTYQERELEALLTDDNQELTQQLKVQLAVAFMNNQAGADQTSIETALFEAYGWLVQHPASSQVSSDELAVGKQLLDLLNAYNLGLGEVAACETASSLAKTNTPSAIATEILLQASGIPTSSTTPSPTVTSTSLATQVPTTPLPIFNSPTASATSPQHPTNTPVKTTQAPTATNTLKPPTPTNTPKPPTPTNTIEPPTPTNTPEPPTPTFPPEDTPTPTFPPPLLP
jgi:hypothetical protein